MELVRPRDPKKLIFKWQERADAFSRLFPAFSPSPCGMSDYPAPEALSREDLGLILNKLRLLLDNLPKQLPSKPINGPDASRYASLIGFQPDDELVEMTGSKAGALNMHLERVFGHAARSTGDGILPILERGPPICAIQRPRMMTPMTRTRVLPPKKAHMKERPTNRNSRSQLTHKLTLIPAHCST